MSQLQLIGISTKQCMQGCPQEGEYGASCTIRILERKFRLVVRSWVGNFLQNFTERKVLNKLS